MSIGLDQPIDALAMSFRTRNALQCDGVLTIRDAVKLSLDAQLLRTVPGLGPKGIAEMRAALKPLLGGASWPEVQSKVRGRR